METTKKTSPTWIRSGLAGFALGICIVSFSAVSWVAVQIANPPPTPTLLPTPTMAARSILDAAYEALNTNHDLQLTIDTLSPHLEEFTNPDELAEALQYMYMAEIGMGHYQLAAVYAERLIQIAPTPENYMVLARIYDSAGDLEHALANYLIYLDSDDPQLTPELRQLVQDRVDQIQTTLTGSTPTSQP
jgi:tetratricopeptide (TPR) repeat protein